MRSLSLAHQIDSGQVPRAILCAVPVFFAYDLPFSGPSTLRFNPTAGKTYYIAADTKMAHRPHCGLTWLIILRECVRFATEDFDFPPVRRFNNARNGIPFG